jgi:hypothetical protein
MKANTSYPAGYKVATKADRARLLKREVNAGVNLNEGEVLKIEQLICRETSHKDADGNTIISYRLDCSSSVKPRLVPLNIFNPYPKDRNEFMKRSDFFKKVLDFSGSYDDFVDFLPGFNVVRKRDSAEAAAESGRVIRIDVFRQFIERVQFEFRPRRIEKTYPGIIFRCFGLKAEAVPVETQ